jgi:hypothetical protein
MRRPPAPQVLQLWDYQKKTGARASRWNVWPSALGLEPDSGSCSSGADVGAFTDAMPLADTTVGRADTVALEGLYRWGTDRTAATVFAERQAPMKPHAAA